MSKPLVIVESPAKARTIAGFLGDDYVVESSIGHIRDLPRNAADVPAAYKGEKWAREGVDPDNDFKRLYVVPSEKKEQVAKLKRALKDASELYLATDEDREGEAIAWHLLEVLNPQVPVRRMVFHEITPAAIQAAIDEPRELDLRRVDAQETRRILDRLYGYRVSPVLWRKVASGLSAGRVQSVATRLVVDRERARMRFRSASWWDLEGTFATSVNPGDAAAPTELSAGLFALDGTRLATGKDFDEDGQPTRTDVVVLDEAQATALVDDLADAEVSVRSVERKPYRRRPAPPFMTSTLQQEASRKLRLSAAQAMSTAQRLYEGGYITYMRTDSTTLSESAVAAARATIRQRYGADYVPDAPRSYARKVKNAQEAHEAIRPAGETFRTPEEVAREVDPTAARLYELVWQRTIASQMPDAVGETVTLRLGGTGASGRDAEFATSGTVITFPGFQRAYVESTDEGDDADQTERRLPPLTEGDRLDVTSLVPSGHETSPPPRFTEASLVKRMEELGVGRPSTYAATIQTIQDRGYAWKKGNALVPFYMAFAVTTLLERHFPDLVDYAFTARMEDDLDEIAGGRAESIPWLRRFYFGEDGASGLKHMVDDRLGDIDAIDVSTIPVGVDDEGTEIVARVGKYGPYLVRGEQKANIPEDTVPDELSVERAIELLEAPSGDRDLGTDPESGLSVQAKAGRYGPYVQLGEMEDGAKEKPRTASLFKTMTLERLTLEDALQLLTLPRVVGVDPADGEEITAQNGRYGPYIKKGSDSRTIDNEELLLTITLEQALAVLAEPKRRRGQKASTALKELGDDVVSGKPMVVKDGRFGPYVTDGETNASLRKGDAVEDITPERGMELLAERRAKGPTTKKKASRKKAPAKKKAGAKKAGAKKAAKKKATGAPGPTSGDTEEP
ncbi:MAG TPA: type I DNA topoisomerase [Acidimicrobiales bacterium]|nr:type I DNA topoisomerase [Acidimicrobiales bacterium]